MYYQGFIKVAAASPNIKTGDPFANIKEIIKQLEEANRKGAEIIVFPELTVCGYSIGDLVLQEYLYRDNLGAIEYLLNHNPFSGVIIIGTFLVLDSRIYNTAFVIQNDKILGIVPKWYLPHTNEFYENRWYMSGTTIVNQKITILDQEVMFGQIVFSTNDGKVKFGVEICQDMWSPFSPSEMLYANGALMVFNCSASPETVEKSDIRSAIVRTMSYRNNGAYIYCSNNLSESTSEVVFSNHKMIYVNGDKIIDNNDLNIESDIIYGDIDLSLLEFSRKSSSWVKNTYGRYQTFPIVNFSLQLSTTYRFEMALDTLPFVPKDYYQFKRIIDMQAASMYKRLDYVGTKKTVVGISGGLDSTLVLLSLVYMCDKYKIDRKNIIAITLPTVNTSSNTYNNALAIMEKLQVTTKIINIEEDVKRQLQAIGHDGITKDTTYENVQARFRTYTLMNLANLNKAIVVGTSDMSEVALGWSTFNGDQMAMYGLNSGLPKTAVKATVGFYRNIYPEVGDNLTSIINTPISPELAGTSQKTEDIIGKYEINDFILYRFLVCGDNEERLTYLLKTFMNLSLENGKKYVQNFFKRFYQQQYKRLTMPEGVKIFKLSLSPRTQLRLNGDIYRPLE